MGDVKQEFTRIRDLIIYGSSPKQPDPQIANLPPLPMIKPDRSLPSSDRFRRIHMVQAAALREEHDERNFIYGSDVFIRIFKEENELELWLSAPVDDKFYLYKTYGICNYSGALGPKLKEGDKQSPEGFYTVSAEALNPKSAYHLSFNLGYPNAFDQANGRTGSFLMVHGKCQSIGCYALGDAAIEEVYTLAYEALSHGQKDIPVHAFPFRMTAKNLKRHAGNPWMGFWETLKAGYDSFESNHVPPTISVEAENYAVKEKPRWRELAADTAGNETL